MKPRKQPKEEGAPAYMAQYTALMTILLAFFICMLTLGQDKAAQYKSGLGNVRNAFGTLGGCGLMPFVTSLVAKNPTVKIREESDKGDLFGYLKGAFEADSLSADGIVGSEVRDLGRKVAIATPISFTGTALVLDEPARRFLARVGGVFFNMPDHTITVCSYRSTGDGDSDLIVAARRAGAVERYLERHSRLPRDQVASVGYADARFIGDFSGSGPAEGNYLIVRKRHRGQEGDTDAPSS